MPSPSGSETSRREAFSEGHGDSEEPLKAERRAAASEEGNLLHGAVPLKSRPNPERRLREQQFAQEAQSTQLLHQVKDAGSANKAPAQRHPEQASHAKLENADAAERPGAAVPLSRYLSTSQQVASALAASRAQLPSMGPPALPKHPGPGPEQEQCIQELRDRVSHPSPFSITHFYACYCRPKHAYQSTVFLSLIGKTCACKKQPVIKSAIACERRASYAPLLPSYYLLGSGKPGSITCPLEPQALLAYWPSYIVVNVVGALRWLIWSSW